MANAPPSPAGNGSVTGGPTAALTAPAPVVRQRDPPTFNGIDGQDVDDWLDEFDRVCRHNRWDDSSKLNNVAFYLSGVAKTWFLNHETEFQAWERFSSRLRDLFGRPAFRKSDAEQKLSTRAQHVDESYMSYIEDILSLCKRCNPEMPDGEKIRYILKGIREDAFQLILAKDLTTVAEILALCKKLQDARNLRTKEAHLQYGSSEIVSLDNLRLLIREIVREEISRLSPACHFPQTESTALVQAIVQEELASAIGQNRSTPLQQSYADVVKSNIPVCPTTAAVSQARQQSAAYTPPVVPVPQLPLSVPVNQPRPRPTCYYCGIPGHTMRFCRRRQREAYWGGRPQFAPTAPYADAPSQDRPLRYANDRYYYPSPPNATSSSGFRNGEYASYAHRSRSPGDRRRSLSRSPVRLTSPPPQRGNM